MLKKDKKDENLRPIAAAILFACSLTLGPSPQGAREDEKID